jgi:type I restriction enzyme S subunit
MSNALTHIETEKQLIPTLRFKEYNGNYRIVNVNDCIEFLTDYHSNGSYERLKENVELLEKEDYAIMIRTTNFEKKDFQNNLLYISEHAYNYLKKSKVLSDDIIINKIANAGATYIMPHLNRPVSLAMNLFMLRTNSNNSGKYIYYKIKTKEFRLRALSSGTGTKTITKQDVKTFKLEIPDLPEQQKIASFLSAVDEKIQQLTKKKALLEDYKKGVMQQLFSGHLRFKDENGKDYPDWELTKLRELCKPITNGTTPKKFKDTGVTFIKIEGIKGINFNKEKCLFIDEATHLKELKRSILKVNDILFAIAGSVGKLGLVTEDLLPANTNQAFAIIRLKNLKSLDFVLQILNSRTMKKYIYQNMSVGAQPNLNLEQMGDFKFSLPSIEEQQKIASYLSAIDTKIEAVNNQITQTQTFKKGLLQQMFV